VALLVSRPNNKVGECARQIQMAQRCGGLLDPMKGRAEGREGGRATPRMPIPGISTQSPPGSDRKCLCMDYRPASALHSAPPSERRLYGAPLAADGSSAPRRVHHVARSLWPPPRRSLTLIICKLTFRLGESGLFS